VLPKHVLIIPDGNRRFAKAKGFSLEEAYELACVHVTTNLVKQILVKRRIPMLSLFGLSYDNAANRHELELAPIYDAHAKTYAAWLADDEIKLNVKFNFIGDARLLPKRYRLLAAKLVAATNRNTRGVCNILIPYDGQREIVDGARKVARKKSFSREGFFGCLQLREPIDLVIRTGRETRLSACPLYQTAYAEIFFKDFYYPEFTTRRLDAIIREFSERERRFGK